MQTMPTKNRTSLLLAGLGLLVVVGVAAAVSLNNRAQEGPAPDPLSAVAEPENGTALIQVPETMADAAEPNPATEAVTELQAAPATDLGTENAEPIALGQVTTFEVPETHVVRPNETLYSISMKYYHDEQYAGDIEELNALSDPNKIEVGRELLLPRPETLPGLSQ